MRSQEALVTTPLFRYEGAVAEGVAYAMYISFGEAMDAVARRAADVRAAFVLRVPPYRTASSIVSNMEAHGMSKGNGSMSGFSKYAAHTAEHLAAEIGVSLPQAGKVVHGRLAETKKAFAARVPASKLASRIASNLSARAARAGLAVGFEFDPREIDRPYVRTAVLRAKIATARAKGKTLSGVRWRPNPVGAAPMMFDPPPGHVGWASGRVPLVYEPSPRRVPLVYEPPPARVPPARVPLVYEPPGRARGKSSRAASSVHSGGCKCKAKCACKPAGMARGASMVTIPVRATPKARKATMVRIPEREARDFFIHLPPGAWTAATHRLAARYGFSGGSGPHDVAIVCETPELFAFVPQSARGRDWVYSNMSPIIGGRGTVSSYLKIAWLERKMRKAGVTYADVCV